MPLLIDSPEYPTTFKGDSIDVEIPLALIGGIKGASFDRVTAGLKVNGNLHAPLLCVSDVSRSHRAISAYPAISAPAK